MPLSAWHVHNAKSEVHSFVQAGTFGDNAPPNHKGFCITCGSTTSGQNYYWKTQFDVLLRDARGVTFYQRVAIPLGASQYFPIEIAGVSGNPTIYLDPSSTGLSQHQLYYYF